MNIIAHRGYWLNHSEKNTSSAFSRAIEHGFGIETDFRDFNGELVISHDVPLEGAMKADEFISLCRHYSAPTIMALNIKSDGLYLLVKKFIAELGMSNYFVFDMSVPDTRGYLAEQIPVFTRLSEYESMPCFLDQSRGIWLDSFESEWYDKSLIKNLLDSKKQVAIVSPELHRRSHLGLWRFLKENDFYQNCLISLCTDFPLDAKEYFNAKN